MRFLHTSDWHLGKRPVGGVGEFSNTRFNDYFESAKWVVKKAIEEKVDLILISGDIFDRSSISPEMLYRTEEIFETVKGKIPVFVIEGNHDRSLSEDSWVDFLEKKGYLSILNSYDDGKIEFKTFKGYNFYGLPYLGPLTEETLKDFMKKINTKNNILIIHTAIGSQEYLPGTVGKEVIDVLGQKFTYIAGGHFHSYYTYPKENPFFFIPGSPEYFDLYERDQKGVIIYDTDSRKFKFIPSKKRSVRRFTIQYNGEEFEKEMKKLAEKEKFSKGEIIIVTIQMSESNYIDTEKLEKFIEEKYNILKAIVRIEYLTENISKIVDLRKDKIEGFEEIAIKNWKNEFSIKARETVEFTNILKKLINGTIPKTDILTITDEFLSSLLGVTKYENQES